MNMIVNEDIDVLGDQKSCSLISIIHYLSGRYIFTSRYFKPLTSIQPEKTAFQENGHMGCGQDTYSIYAFVHQSISC